MAQNISATGMRIAVSNELRVGQLVTVRLCIPRTSRSTVGSADATSNPATSEEHHLQARVVRVEPNADDPEGMWPYRAALRFARSADAVVAALAEMS